ncbi:helix-turn-helix domain-containing protein [Elizabethkingia argenteiflava]|uniref:helix-turn-helix domain-containing protein n=1 Tax=Elizabethkingia argenteiflava TaxID=2681556 RepID=UPI0037428891
MKLKVLHYAKEIGNISQACRYYVISREAFYQWKRAYDQEREQGLVNSKPCPETPKLRTPNHIEDLILYLRKTYYFGPNGSYPVIMGLSYLQALFIMY